MHDQHFQIRPLDLNRRPRSAQKAAGSFVSGEKLLGTSRLKTRRSRLQTRAFIMPRSTTKPRCEDTPAEAGRVVYRGIKLEDRRLSSAAAAVAAVVVPLEVRRLKFW